jgi:hypothetical protein
MEYTFHIQDPTDGESLYMYEALVGEIAADTLQRWRGIYAFVTGNAVRSLLIEDKMVAPFIRRGATNLIVGLDAVTDVSALEQLAELTRVHENFEARVFFNPASGLFHPKISHFQHSRGRSTVIVGSGNFTPGGFRRNIEAYSIIRGRNRDIESVIAWDQFLDRHAADIRLINDEAIAGARQNMIEARARKKRVREAAAEEVAIEIVPAAEADVVEAPVEEEPVILDARVLLGFVPRASDRWHQIHFSRDITNEFFRVRPGPQRLFLRERRLDGRLGPEEIRPVVYSLANKNYKVEVSARRGEPYPEEGPPIILFKELGLRTFTYMLLMPRDEVYRRISDLLNELPRVGGGLRRSITDYRQVLEVWPNWPL